MTVMPVIKSAIDEERLDGSDYLQSLVKAAFRLKLIDESCVERIQLQLLQMLSGHVERYTRGESSSVTVEKAQMLTQSILYGLGVRLKSLSDNREALSAITGRPLSELYEEGMSIIREMIGSAEALLEKARAGRIVTDLEAYNETVDEALPGFFQAYDSDFQAHETAASIDYPLGFDRMDLSGIEYIHIYLQKLNWENHLCSHYSERDLRRLLNGYDRHYSALLVNVFQLVLTNALGSLLAGGSALCLMITGNDRSILQQRLACRCREELSDLMERALEQLFLELGVDEPSFRQYVRDCTDGLAVRLGNAVQSGRLESIFLQLREDDSQDIIYCDGGKKLEDRAFRSLTELIRLCREPSEKIALVSRHIHSRSDLVDLLEAECFQGDEFTVLFSSLGEAELAILIAGLPFNPCDGGICHDEDDREWKSVMAAYLKKLERDRLERIMALSEKIAI